MINNKIATSFITTVSLFIWSLRCGLFFPNGKSVFSFLFTFSLDNDFIITWIWNHNFIKIYPLPPTDESKLFWENNNSTNMLSNGDILHT